jgi:GLPGLI family protein
MITLFLFGVTVSAQELREKALKPVKLIVSYSLDQLCDYPNESRKEDWREEGTVMLEIADGMAHSYVVQEKKNTNSSLKSFMKKNSWRLDFNIHALLGEVYIGYPQNGKLMQIVNLDAAGIYQYTEDMPTRQWKIESEHKKVLGYDCQKATCTFCGRTYEVWFAADIPLSYGPYKFGGLPGLILELVDAKNEYHFIAKGIETPKEKTNIMILDEDIRPITRSKARKMFMMMHKDHGAYASDYGIMFRLEGLEHLPIPYYPIELK